MYKGIKLIKKLLVSDETSYKIAKETGLPTQTIDRYRVGGSDLNNMSLKIATKLYDYAKQEDQKMNKFAKEVKEKAVNYYGVEEGLYFEFEDDTYIVKFSNDDIKGYLIKFEEVDSANLSDDEAIVSYYQSHEDEVDNYFIYQHKDELGKFL